MDISKLPFTTYLYSVDLKELASGINPWQHWYYQSKKKPLLQYLQSIISAEKKINVYDIGAGSGFFSETILKKYPLQIEHVWLIDTGYTEQEIAASKNTRLQKVHTLPPVTNNALYILMDVLEHLKEEATMLDTIHSTSKGNGNFFITVPAFQSVWSAHDIYLEHYRRYSRTTLMQLLVANGFKTKRCYYLYGSLFPFVFIKRKLGYFFSSKNTTPNSDMKTLPNWLNTLLLKYSSLEMLVTKYNIFFGLTCVAEGEC